MKIFELQEELKNANLEKACTLASSLEDAAAALAHAHSTGEIFVNPKEAASKVHKMTEELHYMLEYFRLCFDLTQRDRQ